MASKVINKLGSKIFFILPLLVALGLVLVFFVKERTSLSTREYVSINHSIILTKNGFMPETLTINQGDSVTFSTDRQKEFWPASDIHPTHELYPEFDPKKPIEPLATWQFTFNKPGEWGYHDHLAPLFRANIIVKEVKASSGAKMTVVDNCKSGSSLDKEKCWEDELDKTLKKQGVSAAFDLFSHLFVVEPVFAENCHGFTHRLGQAAYEEFQAKKDFPVTPQVAYCSYGFFHGFIEAMMQKSGTAAQAKEMCEYLDKKLSKITYVLGSCFHGIGHGVTDGSDPRTFGDPQAIVAPGLKLCEELGVSEYYTKACATGVFNALAIMYEHPEQYKLTLDRSDPYLFCHTQENPDFKHACYDDFKILPMYITNNDFLKAARFVERIPGDDTYAQDAIDNLATFNTYFILKDPTYDKTINQCHQLQPRLRERCISGMAAGFMTAGIPDQEYIRGIELCSSPLINDGERESCYQRLVPLIKLRYPVSKSQDICRTLDEKYRNLCT